MNLLNALVPAGQGRLRKGQAGPKAPSKEPPALCAQPPPPPPLQPPPAALPAGRGRGGGRKAAQPEPVPSSGEPGPQYGLEPCRRARVSFDYPGKYDILVANRLTMAQQSKGVLQPGMLVFERVHGVVGHHCSDLFMFGSSQMPYGDFTDLEEPVYTQLKNDLTGKLLHALLAARPRLH